MRAARVVNPATAALLVQTVRNLLFNAKGDCDGGPPRRASCSRMTATRSSAVEAARPSPSSTPSLPSRRPSIGDAADLMQRFSTFPQHCELLLLFRGQNEWITWSRFLKFLIGAGNDPPHPTVHQFAQLSIRPDKSSSAAGDATPNRRCRPPRPRPSAATMRPRTMATSSVAEAVADYPPSAREGGALRPRNPQCCKLRLLPTGGCKF